MFDLSLFASSHAPAISLVADSEQIGMSTLTQMSMQREQMQFASDDLNSTINASARARQILKHM